MAEKQLLTKKGYEERVALLEHLKVDRRKEVAQKLKEAREQGDLSENAEYDAAKDEQRDIETQIAELEEILKNAEVVQDNNTDKDAIKMESVVKLHDVEYDEDIEYVIVGSSRYQMNHHLEQLCLARRLEIQLRLKHQQELLNIRLSQYRMTNYI